MEYVRTWIAEFDSNRYDIWIYIYIHGIYRYIHRYLDILDIHTWRLNYTPFFWQEGEMVHDGSTILKRVLMPLLGFFLRFQTLCKRWTRFSFFAFSSAKKLSQLTNPFVNVKWFFFTKIPIENWICHATHPIRRSPLYPIEASGQRWGRWKPWPIGSVKMKDRWAAMIVSGKPYVENWEADFFWWFLWIAKYIVYTNLYIIYRYTYTWIVHVYIQIKDTYL